MRLALPLILAAAALAGVAHAGSGAPWKARDPVTACPDFQGAEPPGNDGVVALFRCARETIDAAVDELWLTEDVVIHVGEGRDYEGANELMELTNADTTKPVYPLTGSWTWVHCRLPKYANDAARNCSSMPVTDARGACWMTTAGLWRCNLTGTTGDRTEGSPPPQ